MKNYPNKTVKNVKSPKNEKEYIQAYSQLNKNSKKNDGFDISAVKTKSGERGHALLPQNINRSKDNQYHHGKDFISNSELRKQMKK